MSECQCGNPLHCSPEALKSAMLREMVRPGRVESILTTTITPSRTIVTLTFPVLDRKPSREEDR